MEVEIRNIESGELIMSVENVKDIGDGCCDMMVIQTESKNILYKVRQDEYVVITKDISIAPSSDE
jgi:hypothetical protein